MDIAIQLVGAFVFGLCALDDHTHSTASECDISSIEYCGSLLAICSNSLEIRNHDDRARTLAPSHHEATKGNYDANIDWPPTTKSL